jgi:GntR family transcriptional regulator, transcriptional repressor for pyruvate dehydrogenase complex
MFKQIKVRHISEEVFDQIKSAILEGKVRPGEKLPAERELMKELGVSRVPIREALKLLANIGLVETRQGGGSYVRSLLADRVHDPLNYILKDNVERVFELLEVRKEIETGSAYYAAKRATAKEIEALWRIIEETKTYLDRKKTPPVRLDADLHLVIAQSSHNTIRAHLTHTIYNVFSEYFSFLIENVCFNKEYQQSVYDQHFKIYDAISRGDAEGARLASIEHLAFVEDGLRKQMTEAEDKRVRGKES